jgi:hypothetical protein
MNSDKKPEKENLIERKISKDKEDNADLPEGKTLHDFYRHTNKLIR